MWVNGGETVVGATERETRTFLFISQAKTSVGVKLNRA
jgi:hypothetical protein